jgi:hypothetical protein
MDAALLRELQDRGRFFYERFPGAAAAEEWKRHRERAEREEASRKGRGSPAADEGAAATTNITQSWSDTASDERPGA